MTRHDALIALGQVESVLVESFGTSTRIWPEWVMCHYRAFDDVENQWDEEMTPQQHRHLFWLENICRREYE